MRMPIGVGDDGNRFVELDHPFDAWHPPRSNASCRHGAASGELATSLQTACLPVSSARFVNAHPIAGLLKTCPSATSVSGVAPAWAAN